MGHSRSMRSNPTRLTIHLTIAAAFVVVAAGCGDGDTSASDGAESSYCDAAREWSIHELEPLDDADPAAFRAYWEDFVAFEKAAADTAPEEVADDWDLKIEAEVPMNAVLDKYDYDTTAIMQSGTPDEQAAFEPPPEARAAQDRILVYESAVCGAMQPLAADVSYSGEEPGRYCELVAVQDERAAEALASGDPADVEAMFDELAGSSADLIDAAPAVIKDDVKELAVWATGRQRDAAERYGYDLRTAIREGTPKDRADIQHSAEEIREQFARVLAYEQQICYG